MPIISKRYFIKRTIQTVVLIWIALTVLFVLFRLMPGDYTTIMIGRGASEAAVAEFEERWGLNDPLYVQYFRYVINLLQGDAGNSLEYGRPVIEHVRLRIFNSFILIAPGITAGYLLGSLYGLIAGTNRGHWIETRGIIAIVLMGAFPSFFLAIVMIIVFAGWADLFPTGGLVSTATRSELAGEPWYRIYLTRNFLWHYTLPFVTIAMLYTYLPSLIMRTSVVEVMGQDFHKYKRIVGLPARQRLKSVAKHASLPVITFYPISMTQAIGGLVLIEIVFSWPGIGYTLVQAVFQRDIPVLMFVFFLIAVFIIIANYVIDLLYGVIDPRVNVE